MCLFASVRYGFGESNVEPNYHFMEGTRGSSTIPRTATNPNL